MDRKRGLPSIANARGYEGNGSGGPSLTIAVLPGKFFSSASLSVFRVSTDAPEISLTADKAEIHEQDTVRFHCKTSAYPPPVSINWYRNDEPIKVDEGQDVLELSRVSRRANGNTISCEVRNAVGVNRSTIALNVIYKPQFKTNDKPVMAQLGKCAKHLIDILLCMH